MHHDRLFRTPPRRLAPRGLILLLVLLGLTGPAVAQPSETERAILQVSVNGVERGEVVVLLRSPDVLVRVVDLERAGLIGFGGRRETVGSDVYVSLISLAPLSLGPIRSPPTRCLPSPIPPLANTCA